MKSRPEGVYARDVSASSALSERDRWGKARQALEHSGKDGGAVKHSIEVRFVAAPELRNKS
jgi:hypothetical protein